MKLRHFLIIIVILLSLASCGKKKNYTLENLRLEITALTEDAEIISLAKAYIENADDMEIISEALDNWIEVDAEGAREYCKAKYLANANSLENVYLYGRTVEDPVEAVKLGREAAKLAPELPFGCRLIASAYSKSLFRKRGEAEILAKLKKMLPEDESCFEQLSKIDMDTAAALGFLKEFRIYNGEYDAAMEILKRGESMEAGWATPLEAARIHALLGEFEEVRELLTVFVEERVVEGRIPVEERDDYISYYFLRSLRRAGSYDQAIEYIKRSPGYGKDPQSFYDVAVYCALKGDTSRVFEFLAKAAEAGYNSVKTAESDEDLAGFRDNPRWKTLIDRFKQNWDKGRDARKKAALASKIEMAAPEWELVDAAGDTVRLTDLRGSVLVLDFFATWCAPCKSAMPEIDDFKRNHAGEEVLVFSINVWERGREKVKKFMKKKDYSMTLLFGGRELTKAYGVSGIPTIFVVDKEGIIRYKEVGYEEGLKEKLVWWTRDLVSNSKGEM